MTSLFFIQIIYIWHPREAYGKTAFSLGRHDYNFDANFKKFSWHVVFDNRNTLFFSDVFVRVLGREKSYEVVIFTTRWRCGAWKDPSKLCGRKWQTINVYKLFLFKNVINNFVKYYFRMHKKKPKVSIYKNWCVTSSHCFVCSDFDCCHFFLGCRED